MTKNKFGEIVYTENDLVDLLMTGHSLPANLITTDNVVVDNTQLDDPIILINQTSDTLDVVQYDQIMQSNWFMPDEYKQLDIAEYILGLCENEQQLQRVGHELLLYQEKKLFDLLKYLKYLVDTMKQHSIIWGVGRGSSVASYVLYLLGVHRVDSIYYDLDPKEFLR